ncbi:MAG: redoxin domain-containing protein, partial [Dehalococcoidia bacterium]|nr:redoxin domain-containing protein [Dehalococcoidia bacterium]
MTNPISRLQWLLLAASVVTVATVSCQPAVPKATTPSGVAATRQIAPRVGSLAPDFTVKMLTGETLRLSDLRGKPVFLNFWASWCPPCRAEMPILQQVFEDKALSDRGLVLLGIDLGEDPATVDSFMKSNGLSFTVLLD